MNNYNEIPKYKKKKKQSSDSSKRSDHKHEYERVISGGLSLNCIWMKRCKICGRFQSLPFHEVKDGLYTEEYNALLGRYVKKPLTIPEIHQKFPNVRVFIREKDENGKINFDDSGLIEVIFTNTPDE